MENNLPQTIQLPVHTPIDTEKPASIILRIFAFIMDQIIGLVFTIICTSTVLLLGVYVLKIIDAPVKSTLPTSIIVFLVICLLLYNIINEIFLTSIKGGSLGKLINGLRVTPYMGTGRISFFQATKRLLGKIINQGILAIIVGVGYGATFLLSKVNMLGIVPLINTVVYALHIYLQYKLHVGIKPGRRGLQDVIGGTQVIEEKKGLHIFLQIILIIVIAALPSLMLIGIYFVITKVNEVSYERQPVAITPYINEADGWQVTIDANRYDVTKSELPEELAKYLHEYHIEPKDRFRTSCFDSFDVQYMKNGDKLSLRDFQSQNVNYRLDSPIQDTVLNGYSGIMFTSDVEYLDGDTHQYQKGKRHYYILEKDIKVYVLSYPDFTTYDSCQQNLTDFNTMLQTFKIL